MAKKAVIVESPTKAKTIKGFLGRDYLVLSSSGHIKDLPKSKLGIAIDNNFEPTYITIKGKKRIISEIKKAVENNVDEVYLGCDPDREGEAIAYHIAQELNSDHRSETGKPKIHRVLFYEITPSFVRSALLHPTDINFKKVDAHKARRVLDRIFGYFTSPLLWRILRRGLSAGRVQTVALRLLCEREDEIIAFKPVPYWVVEAIFKTQENVEIKTSLHSIKGKSQRIEDEEILDQIKRKLKPGTGFTIKKFEISERRQRPAPPYITSTLQQEAIRRFNFSASKTMRIAQALYEGVELKEGRIGLITYMRTDSRRVADAAIAELRRFIRDNFSKEYISPTIHKYKDRKTSEGAHEAIRPTSILRTPASVKEYLDEDQYKLYSMIYEKFLATQMSDAVYRVKEVIVQSPDGEFEFRAVSTQLQFPGYLKAFSDFERLKPAEEDSLPDLKTGEKVTLIKLIDEKRFTEPPARYSEASLIKKLEINGIGRPSTYAKIIQTLFDRQYIEKDRGRLVPTELGMTVIRILIKKFSNVFDLSFTAGMEKELDMVEEGDKSWQEVVRKFYEPFIIDVKEFESASAEIKKSLITKTERTCPKCGSDLIIKWGKYGKFYSCDKFPECKYTEPIEQKLKVCPKCNSPMLLKKGKFGRFYACTRFPECRHTERYSTGRHYYGDSSDGSGE